jgi:hypothetical protein
VLEFRHSRLEPIGARALFAELQDQEGRRTGERDG